MIDEEICKGFKTDEVYISIDKTEIIFQNNSELKRLHIKCTADCCSESWIEHVNNSEDTINSEIVGIKSVDDIELPFGTKQSVDIIYGYKFYLNIKREGKYIREFSIEMRNSSNGYYGGSAHAFITKSDCSLDNRKYIPLKEDF